MSEPHRHNKSSKSGTVRSPLPSLRDQRPRWDDAAALGRKWRLMKRAERLDGLAAKKEL